MSDVENLLSRIDAEFSALDDRIKKVQAEQLQEHQQRQQRLASFEKLLAELREVWKPRLAALLERFRGKVKVTPRLSATNREATMEFESKLAHISLRLSASTDHQVRNLVLDYNLEILPILMKFDSHQRAEWPLDKVDRQAIAQWVDDRLVDFVKAYLALHENEYYLRDHMVEDPIAGVRFPRFAAAASLEADGMTYYFIDEATRRQFADQRGIAAKQEAGP